MAVKPAVVYVNAHAVIFLVSVNNEWRLRMRVLLGPRLQPASASSAAVEDAATLREQADVLCAQDPFLFVYGISRLVLALQVALDSHSSHSSHRALHIKPLKVSPRVSVGGVLGLR